MYVLKNTIFAHEMKSLDRSGVWEICGALTCNLMAAFRPELLPKKKQGLSSCQILYRYMDNIKLCLS